jgi:hypothetical protein
MDPVIIAGLVVVFVQGFKEALTKFGFVLKGNLALIVTLLASLGFTIIKTLGASLPVLSVNMVLLFVQVAILALGGYGLIKVASGTATPPTPPTV